MTDFKNFVYSASNIAGNCKIEINISTLILSEIADQITYISQYTSDEAKVAIAELTAASIALKKYLK